MIARTALLAALALGIVVPSVLGQEVDFTLIVSNDIGNFRQLHFGLDPTATNGIDAHLGEFDLPPSPPGFEARFVGSHASVPAELGGGSYRDYREGNGVFLGEVRHQISYLKGEGATVTIAWDLPLGVTGHLQDTISGEIVDEPMAGQDEFTVTNPDGIPTLLMTITYAPVEVDREEAGLSDWRMLSAPVYGITVQDLADQSLVQGIPGEYPSAQTNIFVAYNGDNADNEGGNRRGFVPPAGLGAPLQPGLGFIWFLWDDAFDPGHQGGESSSAGLPLLLEAGGPAYQGEVTVTIADRGNDPDSWFLIGNPFAEAFDPEGISASSGTLQEAMWRWIPRHKAAERDAPVPGAYVLLDDLADPWDGFFAEVTEYDLPLDFTFDARCRNGCPGERAPAERHRVQLVLTGTVGQSPAYDEAAYVLFVDGASDGWDRHDSSKLYPIGSMWAAVSPMGDRFGEHVPKSIESRPLPVEAVDVPVSISTLAAGEFTLALGAGTSAPPSWSVELEDTATGQIVDLASGPMAFSVSGETWLDERFVLRVNPGTISGGAGAPDDGVTLGAAYPNPTSDRATLTFTLPRTTDVQLTVFDALGRRVALLASGEHAAGAHTAVLETRGLAAGVYVARLAAAGRVIDRRLTVLR